MTDPSMHAVVCGITTIFLGMMTVIILASVVINDKNTISGWDQYDCYGFDNSEVDSGYCYDGYMTAYVDHNNETFEIDLFYPGTNYPFLVDCIKSSTDITSWISSLTIASTATCYVEDIEDGEPRGVTVISDVNTWIMWLSFMVIGLVGAFLFIKYCM